MNSQQILLITANVSLLMILKEINCVVAAAVLVAHVIFVIFAFNKL